MTDMEIMQARHSVRKYTDRPIEQSKIDELEKAICAFNAESGLHIQLFTNEPQAFAGTFGCCNYFAVVGQKGADIPAGYYGERLVLLAQKLGLNTCWVGMSYKRSAVKEKLEAGEKLIIVIGLGYGQSQGSARKSKAPEDVSNVSEDSPKWFKDGVSAALLAPTAINQQKFHLQLNGNRVSLRPKLGFYSKVDLGIVKCHFELGAGVGNFVWEEA